MTASPLSARTFAAGLIAILLLGAALRFSYPTADPPWRTTVGVVWHDEGAWTHNARNRALFGEWRLDAWNPMFVAPVFTALEYGSFATFGVGTWQARLVSQTAGMLAVLLLGLGAARISVAGTGREGGRLAGLIAAAWLATNYVYVMYDRAAIMESLMAAFVVFGWYGYVRAQREPMWGLFAGTAAILAYFTKAAAIFFIAALGLACLWSLAFDKDRARKAALWTLAGLTIAGLIALATFVIPWWTEYRFYNWQMSVTRKPSYDLRSIVDRITWFPILHDVFTRMWFVWAVGLIAWVVSLARFRDLQPPERLLTLWIGIGSLELLIHDVGNERRFVFLIPALVAIASLAITRLASPAERSLPSRATLLLAFPLVLYVAYLLIGALARLAFIYEIRPNVRLTAALAVIVTVLFYAMWPKVSRWAEQEPPHPNPLPKGEGLDKNAGRGRRFTPSDRLAANAAREVQAAINASRSLLPIASPAKVAIVAILVVAGNVAQFAQFAIGRTYANYEASVALGKLLPPGTLVHGKLANGLALENRIRPLFVGRNFGNYDDRLTRDDVPYVLTYVAPREGYEGPVILDVLGKYPQRRTLWTFDVRETPGGTDRAALMEKGPPAVPAPALDPAALSALSPASASASGFEKALREND
jgi:4-amino-4-deoxy-L-arabinose transferase-like glycosyltransferase